MRTSSSRSGFAALAFIALLVRGSGAYAPQAAGPCVQTAAEYLQTDATHVLPGETVTVSGMRFAPSCDVTLVIHVPGSDETIDVPATADGSGALSVPFTVGSLLGDYSIRAMTAGNLSLATAQFSNGPYVTTDKTDYQPGERVTFSGRGFEPGESIDLLVHQTHPGGAADRGATIVADAAGSFVNKDFVVTEEDRNTTLSVTAIGQASGISVVALFSDALTFVVGQKYVNATDATPAASLSVAYATSPTSGNLLVAVVGGFGNGTIIGAPLGWSTAVNEAGTATTPAQAIFYKISAGAADSSVTATFAPATTSTITVYEFSGVLASSDPLDGTNSSTGSSAFASTGAVTPLSGATTDLIVGAASVESTSATLTMPAAAISGGFTAETSASASNTTVNGGGSGAERIATQSADKKGGIGGGNAVFQILGSPILGWRAQGAAFKAKGDTVATISVSPDSPVLSGATVTLTATVTPTSGVGTVAGGTVTFTDGGVAITGCGSQAVSAGAATCITTTLAVGTHSTIRALYNGDDTHNPSLFAFLPPYVVNAPAATDCFRSAATGNWNVVANWQEAALSTGSCPVANVAYVPAATAPTSAAARVQVRSGHTITVSAAATATDVIVDPGGDLEIAAGQTLSFGTGADVTVDGSLGVAGTLDATPVSGTTFTVDSFGHFTVASGGSYTGNTLNVFTINSGGTATLNGPVTIGSPATLNGNVIASANLTIQGPSNVSNLQIGGAVTMTAGTLAVSRATPGSTGSVNSGGVLRIWGTSAFTIGNAGTFNVATGGTVDFAATNSVTGGATFATASGSNIKVAAAGNAITTNIATAGRSLNASTNWTFDGAAAQTIDGALLGTVGDLIIDNPLQTVTLTGPSLNIQGTLTVLEGTFAASGSLTLLTGAGGVSNSGTISLDGGAAGCGSGNTLLIRSNLPGTQRLWSGGGLFNVMDVDVQDQAGSAAITAYSSTSSGNNGANWNIISACVASAANSTIAGTTPVVADGIAASTITITLRDASNNPISGVVPTFSATDIGSTNVYGPCSASNGSGISTCTLKSTSAQLKTLQLLTPISLTGGTVLFTSPTASLTVKKHVVNDNGGLVLASAWFLTVSSSNFGTGGGSAPGSETGTVYTLQPGKQYSVTESPGPVGYAASSSPDCTIASAVAGEVYTCTITNDDVAPTLTVITHVVNDNGGTRAASAWTLTVSSSNGGSGTGSAPGSESGTVYTLQNLKQYSVSQSPFPGYTQTSFGCGIASAALATNYTCTITNDDTPSSLFVKKHVVNDNGGTATAGAWTLTVSSANGGTGTGSAAGSEFGTGYTLQTGKQYAVTESGGPSGYAASSSGQCTVAAATQGTVYVCTITNDDQPHLVTVTSSSAGNGTIAPEGAQTVNDGATPSFILTPNAGYHIDSVTGTCGGSLVVNTFTAAAVTADCTVVANFAINTYTVTSSSTGNGTIAPSGAQAVNHGAAPAFLLTPTAGYHIDSVSGTCGGSLLTNTFTTAAVAADCAVVANFAINQYSLNYAAGANGSLSGSASQTVSDGGSGSPVSAVPGSGYHFTQWSDGSTANPRTDTNVHANISVTASFAAGGADVYSFQGFFAPIDMPQTNVVIWNSAKAGQAIPAKWRLLSGGLPVSNPSSFDGLYSYPVSCTTGASIDAPVEEYATGNSSLQYNGDGNWQYNWKTPANYKNTCRVMYVRFSDGTNSPGVNFKFK